MTYVWQVSLIGTLAGVLGTGLGGLFIVLFGKPQQRMLGFLLAFSGGIMLGVVLEDLLPEALVQGGPWPTLAGLLSGILAVQLISGSLPQSRASLLRTGTLIGIGIAVHNFPEGLAVGAGYTASERLGLELAAVLALHNIPEGMAMTAPLLAGSLNPFWADLLAAATGLPMGIGALLGALIGTFSSAGLAWTLGSAGGAMLYLVFSKLFPQAQTTRSPAALCIGAVAGIIAGFLV